MTAKLDRDALVSDTAIPGAADADAASLTWGRLGLRTVVGLGLACLIGWGSGVISGQPPAPSQAEGDAATDGPKDPRGRLPNYYRYVVTAEQRTEMYDVMKKYESQISELQAQIRALEAKRDAELETLLTPDQKAKLVRFKQFYEQEKQLEKPSAAEGSVVEGGPPETGTPGATSADPAPTP